MVFWPSYPWYIDPPYPCPDGILTPLPMVYRPPYPWYFDPLLMEYRPPYTWYFDLPAYLLIINGGVNIPWGFNLPYRRGSVFYKGVQYTMDENWPWGQFTMRFKIPYETSLEWHFAKRNIFTGKVAWNSYLTHGLRQGYLTRLKIGTVLSN